MSTEMSQTEEEREKKNWKKEKQNVQELGDNYKRYNIRILGIAEGEEREKKQEILEVRMAENFLKLTTHQTTDLGNSQSIR